MSIGDFMDAYEHLYSIDKELFHLVYNIYRPSSFEFDVMMQLFKFLYTFDLQHGSQMLDAEDQKMVSKKLVLFPYFTQAIVENYRANYFA